MNADLVNIYFVSLYLHGHTKNKKWLIRADRSRVEEVTKIPLLS
jgi:hypothetical protein